MVLDRSYRIEGVEALRSVGRALKDIGDGNELKKNLARELRAAGKPAAEDMRADLAKALPDSGGVSASLTRKRFSVKTRLTGDSAGVRIATTKKHQYASLEDTGILRHPVFADAEDPRANWLWVAQSVSGAKGALTEAFEGHRDEFLDGVQAALDGTLVGVEAALRRAG